MVYIGVGSGVSTGMGSCVCLGTNLGADPDAEGLLYSCESRDIYGIEPETSKKSGRKQGANPHLRVDLTSSLLTMSMIRAMYSDFGTQDTDIPPACQQGWARRPM